MQREDVIGWKHPYVQTGDKIHTGVLSLKCFFTAAE